MDVVSIKETTVGSNFEMLLEQYRIYLYPWWYETSDLAMVAE
jgi:hypothetical protein